MDKILSSILCCSFGSRPEQKSSTSSTSSLRNTAETQKRADSKKLEHNDEVEEVGNVSIDKMKANNTQTIILQPVQNKQGDGLSQQIHQQNAKAKTNNISQEPAASPVPTSPSANGSSSYATFPVTQATPDSKALSTHANEINANGQPYDKANSSADTKHEDDDYSANSNSSDLQYEDNDFLDSNQFDLTAMQPDQVVASTGWLLEAPNKAHKNKKCLVLDLDETLVHSSFKYLRSADFVIPVEIEGQIHNVYVIKRPGVDEFMKRVGELYEVVVFTASVSRYGDPLLDELDIHKSVHHRLFRDSCYHYQGNYIKNLSQIGRPLRDLIIIDNSPASYIFHPQHAVPISSWFSDAHDNELLDLLPFLEDLSKPGVDDVSLVLDVTT